MHSSTLIAVALAAAAAAAPAIAAPAPTYHVSARQDTAEVHESRAITLERVNKGLEIATAVAGAATAAVNGWNWIQSQLHGSRDDAVYDRDVNEVTARALSRGQIGGVLEAGSNSVELFGSLSELYEKVKGLFHHDGNKRSDVDAHALGQAFAHMLTQGKRDFGSTVQRREPFVVTDDSGFHPLSFPTLKNANGESFTFHALARSLNELD